MHLELLVGPIASGKSTYCRQAASQGKIIVNDDSIVMALHAGDYTLYEKALKPLYKTVENAAVQASLLMGKTVVVDRPNYSRQMRKRYIGIAKSFDATVDIIMFKQEPLEIHACRRAEGDARGYDYDYWLGVARYHNSLYEAPDKVVEHFDKIIEWNWPGDLTHAKSG